jgi:hypothetical protein
MSCRNSSFAGLSVANIGALRPLALRENFLDFLFGMVLCRHFDLARGHSVLLCKGNSLMWGRWASAARAPGCVWIVRPRFRNSASPVLIFRKHDNASHRRYLHTHGFDQPGRPLNAAETTVLRDCCFSFCDGARRPVECLSSAPKNLCSMSDEM